MKEAQEVIAAFGADVQVAQLVRGDRQGRARTSVTARGCGEYPSVPAAARFGCRYNT
jgi:hypothetical protein